MIGANFSQLRKLSSSPTLRRYAEVALRLAQRGGRYTRRYFRRPGLKVIRKADGSPVTAVDRETEQLLRRILADHYPTHAIVGEEYGQTPAAGNLCWYIDPIDGTQSFLHGIPLYTILIALFDGSQPLLGLIHNPILQETVIAIAGGGCLYNGQRCQVVQRPTLTEARLQFSDAAHLEQQCPGLLSALVNRCALARTWCDGYGYLLLVTGRADIVIDAAMQPWDIAPLYPIVQEAGGHISDLQGYTNPLAKGGEGCLACSPPLARQLLSIVQQL